MANTDLQNLADELRELRLYMEANFPTQTISGAQVIVVAGLSDISEQLGTVTAGEFRVGNRVDPGKGFTGGRFGYPGFTYGSDTYFLAGVANDVLQVGLSLTDGKVYAGAGAVVLDVDGISILADNNNYLQFVKSDGTLVSTISSFAAVGPSHRIILGSEYADGTGDAQIILQAVQRTVPQQRTLLSLDTGFYSYLEFSGLADSADKLFNIRADSNTKISLSAHPSAGATVFNEQGDDIDFRVEGDTIPNLFLVNAGTDGIEIGGTITLADAKNIVLGTTTGTQIGTSTSEKLAFLGGTPQTPPSWTVSNVTTDRVLNADSYTAAEMGDVVATLIQDLKNYGLFT